MATWSARLQNRVAGRSLMATRALAPPSHAYEALLDQHPMLCKRGDVHVLRSATIQRDRCFAKAVRPPRHTARLLRSPRHIVAIFPLAVGILLLSYVGVATAASGRVAVFPVPGSKSNRPQTQITFRGVPASQLGLVRVLARRRARIRATSRLRRAGRELPPGSAICAGETQRLHRPELDRLWQRNLQLPSRATMGAASVRQAR